MAELVSIPADAKEILDDEDLSSMFGFDETEAWSRLHAFEHVTEIMCSTQVQEELEIVVGRNVTDEHRWKSIVKDTLQQVLRKEGEHHAKLIEMLQELEPDSSILVEYVPERSGQEDAFLVYADVKEMNEASELVQKLELLQRLKLRLVTEKMFQRRWDGAGTERKIERWKRVPHEVPVETKALSVFPVTRSGAMELRTSNDVRDGLVELLPVKWNTKNMRRMISDRATQVKPPAAHRFIQTVPTFPTNAATQYLFDAADNPVDPSMISQEWLNKSTECMSKEAHFNLIDQYKNEYGCFDDDEKGVLNYKTPRIDEVMSFMNRAVCVGRNVCSMDWHPELSGIFVASYTFEIASKLAIGLADKARKSSEDTKLDRMLFEKCPVLMWTFKDPLEPLLELQSIREVTTVSFCPFDGDLLVGGLANGQIALWDLRGEIERVELARKVALESNEYRDEIQLLMENDAKQSVDRMVSPAALSSLEHASRGAISCIKWLPRDHFCTTTGHLKVQPEKQHRFLVTSSLDGTVCFWDLDFSMPALQKLLASKKSSSEVVEKTIYQRVNNLFFPTFKLLCQAPIASLIFDEASYLSSPETPSNDFAGRVKHLLRPSPVECRMSLILGTLTGELLEGKWEGYDFEQGTLVNNEPLQVTHTLSPIHDGPIVALERNPNRKQLFLSIGGHVLALWSEEDFSSPIFWRKKQVIITAGRWSLDRAAVFYIGLANGDFEIWDLNMKTYSACVSLNLGAVALTTVSQHRLSSARHCLAIADGNANVRVLSLASMFVKSVPNEDNTLREVLHHELTRKADQNAWIAAYDARNPITANDQPKHTAADGKERIASEKQPEAHVGSMAKKMRELEKRKPLSARLEEDYQAKQFERFLAKLMQRRNVSPERLAREMRPEMARRRFDAEKRAAIESSISRADGDFVTVQRALRPAKKSSPPPVLRRESEVQKYRQTIANYPQVEAEAREILRLHYLPEMESFSEVLMKSRERRDRVSVDVGVNMEHLLGYETKRSLRRRGLAPRTLLEDLQQLTEAVEQEENNEEIGE